MSGFDPSWLALREPADHRSRNRDVLAACVAHFGDRASLRVVDLGCGTGSNLRALSPHLPPEQDWLLVDHDPRLLEAARATLCGWADAAADDGDVLRLRKGAAHIAVRFAALDLAGDPGGALAGGPDLVTAAALFDLVSEYWMRAFAAALARSRAALLGVLTYDGLERWTPPHVADAAALAAFHAHQGRDKGFGPAAGPHAAAALADAVRAVGYEALEGRSDWVLEESDRALVGELAAGIAGAAREAGLAAEIAEGWLAARRGAAARIGHVDLFARPR